MAENSKNPKGSSNADNKHCFESSNKPVASLPQDANPLQLKLLKKIDQKLNSFRKEQAMFRNEIKRDIASMKTEFNSLMKKAGGMVQRNSEKSIGHMTSDPFANSSAQGLISDNDEIPEICLKECLEELVEDLDLKETHVLDEMVEEKCLTEEEETFIWEQNNRKNQVRRFVILLSKRKKKHFDTFIKIIKRPNNNPDLAKKLIEHSNTLKQSRLNPKCLKCSIQNKVDICDVVDKLYHYDIVGLEFFGKCTGDNSTNLLWGELFDIINRSKNPNSIKIFRNALEAKHDNLAKKVEAGKTFICNCETVDLITQKHDSDTDKSFSSDTCSAQSTNDVDDSSSQIDSSDDDVPQTPSKNRDESDIGNEVSDESQKADMTKEEEVTQSDESQMADMTKEEEVTQSNESQKADMTKEEEVTLSNESQKADMTKEEEVTQSNESQKADMTKEEEATQSDESQKADMTKEEEVTLSDESQMADMTKEEEVTQFNESQKADMTKEGEVTLSNESQKADMTKEEEVTQFNESQKADMTKEEEVTQSDESQKADMTKEEEVTQSNESQKADMTKEEEVTLSDESQNADMTKEEEVSLSDESQKADMTKEEEVSLSDESQKADMTKEEEVIQSDESQKADMTKEEEVTQSDESQKAGTTKEIAEPEVSNSQDMAREQRHNPVSQDKRQGDRNKARVAVIKSSKSFHTNAIQVHTRKFY